MVSIVVFSGFLFPVVDRPEGVVLIFTEPLLPFAVVDNGLVLVCPARLLLGFSVFVGDDGWR